MDLERAPLFPGRARLHLLAGKSLKSFASAVFFLCLVIAGCAPDLDGPTCLLLLAGFLSSWPTFWIGEKLLLSPKSP